MRRVARLFIIKTRFEAALVIYALALAVVDRGFDFVRLYPGGLGWAIFVAGTGTVFMAGARLMETTRRDSGQRRRKDDVGTASQMLA
ncbi:MAG: hypothetical protein ACT4OE_08065 [Sphingosinicella sp.]